MTEPLGYSAAAEDWNEAFAGRPMEMRDWTSLTFGEQQRYAQRECQTKGAVYSSKVSADRVEFTISLPPSLRMDWLTPADAGRIERNLHRAAEKIIAAELRYRSLLAQISQENDHEPKD